MSSRRWNRFMLAALMVGLVAACDEGTSPADDFDPQQAQQTMEDVVSAVETDDLEDAFGSLDAASMLFNTTASVAPLGMTAAEAVALMDAGAGTGGDVLPTEYLGTTFEWDAGQMSYVPSEASGAPSDGVRITYYAIDPTSGMPASPLNALGHVDLRDLSTQTADRLNVEIVRTAGNVTLADYLIELSFSFTQSSFNLTVSTAGFLSNGTDQLNFSVSQDFSATETQVTIDQSFSMDLEGTEKAVSFDAMVTADPNSESEDPETMDATATVSNGTQTVEFDLLWDNNVLDGEIRNNSVVVALLGGTLDDPEFTDPNGNPLTQQQINALSGLWDSLGDMFEFVGELFGFAAF